MVALQNIFGTFSQKCKGQKAQFDGNVDIMCDIYESILFFYKITMHLVYLDTYKKPDPMHHCIVSFFEFCIHIYKYILKDTVHMYVYV